MGSRCIDACERGLPHPLAHFQVLPARFVLRIEAVVLPEDLGRAQHVRLQREGALRDEDGTHLPRRHGRERSIFDRSHNSERLKTWILEQEKGVRSPILLASR